MPVPGGAGERESATDTSISTLELDLAAEFTPHWRTDLVLLAEDIGVTDHNDFIPADDAEDKRPDKLHVEEFTLGYTGETVEAAAGRMTVPFGVFATALLSDPQTLEVGETATEAGAWLAYRSGDWYVGAGAFDGNLRSVAPDENGYLAFVGWQNDQVEIQLGYLSSQYAGKDAPELFNLAAVGQLDAWFASGEFVGALSSEQGQRPRAFALELGREFVGSWNSAVRYQQTSGFSVLDGGDERYEEWAVGVNYALNDFINLGLEYAIGEESEPQQHATLARVAITF